MHVVRSAWSGLPTLYQEHRRPGETDPEDVDVEIGELQARPLEMRAGFTLTDPADPRYQTALAYKKRFAEILHRAALLFLSHSGTQDHADPLFALVRGIDVCLLEYGLSMTSYNALHKNFSMARE